MIWGYHYFWKHTHTSSRWWWASWYWSGWDALRCWWSKPTQDRYAAVEKDIATFAGLRWVAILGIPFYTLTPYTSIRMQLRRNTSWTSPTFANNIYIYILNIIWTVCCKSGFGACGIRHTDFRPRELCLPDDYVRKLLPWGSASTENA